MSRMNLSTQDLFLRLGATPRTRTVKADQVFRKLRADETVDLETLLTKPPKWTVIREPLETAQNDKTPDASNDKS